jgi:hypothetical protein
MAGRGVTERADLTNGVVGTFELDTAARQDKANNTDRNPWPQEPGIRGALIARPPAVHSWLALLLGGAVGGRLLLGPSGKPQSGTPNDAI